jgi:hypothetical protein
LDGVAGAIKDSVVNEEVLADYLLYRFNSEGYRDYVAVRGAFAMTVCVTVCACVCVRVRVRLCVCLWNVCAYAARAGFPTRGGSTCIVQPLGLSEPCDDIGVVRQERGASLCGDPHRCFLPQSLHSQHC